jgi:hypothetical protein
MARYYNYYTGEYVDSPEKIVPRGVTPTVELTPEQKRQARMDELKAEREKRLAEEAAARAKADPMKDPTNRPEAPPEDEDNIYYYGWIGGASSGQWKLYKQPKKTSNSSQIASAQARSEGGATQATFGSAVGANALKTAPSTTTPSTTTPSTTTPSTTTPSTTTPSTTTPSTTTPSTTTPSTASVTDKFAGPSLARDTFRNTLALFFGAAEMNKAWINELYNIVSKFYLTGSTIDESLNLALQDARNNPNLAEFTKRFKGIYDLQDLRQQGKPVTVPTIAEYVKTQSEMADLLSSSGLKDISTEDFTSSLIGKGLSYSTVADRLVKVFDRIDRAPQVIKSTLSRYFPTVDRTTLAKTLLLGEKGVKQLQDELAGYEVLSAAEAQGIAATGAGAIKGGLTEERAKEYAALGETFETITPKLSQVAIATPRASQLAGFSRTQDLGQVGVEKAVISRSAKELQQLEQLSKEEEARFAGKAGRAELGLASQRRANRAF